MLMKSCNLLPNVFEDILSTYQIQVLVYAKNLFSKIKHSTNPTSSYQQSKS